MRSTKTPTALHLDRFKTSDEHSCHPLGYDVASMVFSFGCQRQGVDKEAPPFRIVEIDRRFEAPDTLAAGLRHIVFENRRSQIREDMLVKLDKGTNADY